MRIHSLTLQGFRSFISPQTIDFASMPPGIYQVTGKNLVEPELEGNGAGKSSLFESIYWCLYGRTTEGLKAGTVKNWDNDSKEKCAVGMDLEASAGHLSLFRVWNPNILEVAVNGGDPKPVDQTSLDKLLGVPSAAFLLSLYFPQFVPAFIDLQPAEQTAIFTSVLDLGLWERASTLANTSATQFEMQRQNTSQTRERLVGQAEQLLSTDFEALENGWQSDLDKSIKDLGKVVDGHKKALYALPQIMEQKPSDKTDKELAEANRVVIELNSERRRTAALIDSFTKLGKQATCPSCGQPISPQHVKKETEALTTMLSNLDKTIIKTTKLRTELENEDSIRISAEREQEAIKQQHAIVQGKIDGTLRQIDFLKKQKNPYTAQRIEAEQRGAELADKIEQAEVQIDALATKTAAAGYWVKGFKEIRLDLIKESLDQLAVEVNQTLFALGLRDWSIEFAVERETKSGTVSKAFTTFITAPHTNGAVPWEAWSGGERQRLRIAISLGFGNLIISQMGIRPNLEMWDEPSTWMSRAGIFELLEVLAERARDQKKVILLADHRVLEFGDFAGTITVVKDQKGSRVEL